MEAIKSNISDSVNMVSQRTDEDMKIFTISVAYQHIHLQFLKIGVLGECLCWYDRDLRIAINSAKTVNFLHDLHANRISRQRIDGLYF